MNNRGGFGFSETKFVGRGWRTPKPPQDEGNYLLSVDSNGSVGWRTSSAGNLELGETDSTAYRGDRGKSAYDHSQQMSGNPHNVTKNDVGLENLTNDKQVPYSEKGVSNGVATLDEDGKVPEEQITDIDCGTF